MRFQPQHPGCDGRIKPCGFPPGGFVAAAVNLAMMSPAQRHRELIADLAPQGSALREAQMMGIRRLPAANEAGLLRHISDVVAVTNPAWLRQRQGALVDRRVDRLGSLPFLRPIRLGLSPCWSLLRFE